jgi:hypothetical protein
MSSSPEARGMVHALIAGVLVLLALLAASALTLA